METLVMARVDFAGEGTKRRGFLHQGSEAAHAEVGTRHDGIWSGIQSIRIEMSRATMTCAGYGCDEPNDCTAVE